uniref:VWFA domain-containing protein n=1 Tax=Plectus sambesii TaxID=2011161 RepID=A0A914V089_9BILA
MPSSDEKRYRNISYAFFGVGAAILIAGIVMLVIGIINNNKTCPTCPGGSPTSTSSPQSGCSSDSLNPFAITGYTNSVPWDPTLSDPNSQAYKTAAGTLATQISAAFTNSTANDFMRSLMMATNSATYTLQKVSISQFANPSATNANAPSTGINFYATLVFVGVPGPTADDIQKHLSDAGIYATAYSSTTAGQCSTFTPPPYPSVPPPPNSSPRPPFTCDPTTSKTSVIFLVDAASPTEPGISSTIKQQLIASYLQSFMPSTTSDSWPGLQMGVAIYYGTTAYMPYNFMCNSGACWASTVNSIVVQSSNPSISAYDSHNVSSGLLFAVNEFSQMFGNNDPYGTARLAVLVTDGYQYNGNAVDPAPGLATNLKNAGFKLTAVVATPSASVQNSIKALVSVDWSDSFPLASITQLTNPTLLTYTAKWVCAALPITTPAPPVTTTTTMTTTTLTTTYTLPQLTTTSTPPPTTGPPTTPTLPPNSPCRNLDLLFLIDESQSMHISDGFGAAKSFVINVTDTYKVFPNSRFAWITFNSKIWVQTPFMAAQDFKANVMNTNFNEGSTNFVLGFNATNYTISTSSGPLQNRQPVLIFVSDGNPNDGGTLNQVIALTTYLRCNLNTLIIGLGVSEALTDAQTMQAAIGVGVQDGCIASHYGNITNYNQISIAGLSQVEQYLKCYPASPATSTCNLDIMFVFENSELVNYAGRYLELGAMTQTITDYGKNGSLSYYGDHVGIVYFSSFDGFNGAEFSRSGVLDDPANNNPASSSYSQILPLLNNFNATYQLGGASDLLLGLTNASQLLAYRRNVDNSANIPAIIIMGRGTFKDGDNCCDSPVAFAQNLRTQYGAQMKGVLVGQLRNDSILSSITGTPNIVPSQDYYNDGSAFNDGRALSGQISAWLESVRTRSTCSLPTQLPYCPYYMDIVIIWRSATQNQTFQDVQKFITQMLLAPGTGAFAGAEQNTVTDRLTRIALITYDTNRANLKFDLTQYQYMSDYSKAVGSIPWPNQASLTADLLSEAFKAAQEVLLNSARLYASRSVIVFSDDFSSTDYNDSIINYHLLKDVLDASVFGIYIGQNQSDSFDYRNFTDQRIALPVSTGLNPTKPSAINVANALRNFVCTVSPPPPPPPTAPPTITTQAPCTYPPPPTPSASAQPTKAPAGAWPDITILLDTSANLAPGSNALNDRGFEAVRMFLVNTLQQYRIDFNHTRVSLVTFDGTANVVFTFNQNLNMASLMNAIGNQWEYGPAGTHTADRNLNAALQMVLSKVYNEPSGSGYDPNHINFLWAFVTGNPTDSGYAQSLYQLQSMGIRTQAIGLGTLDQQFLSNFGFDSFDYASPFDPVSGIASPTSPLPHMLYQQTTIYITPPPTLAQVSADIVIVIEESTQLTPGNFINVKGFLTQFFTHLQFGPTGSSVALFSYNNRSLLGWTLNSGNDKAGVLGITSKLSYQNSNISTPNINAALDSLYSVYLNASTGYQNRSTFVIFLTSSSTVSPDLDAGKALLVRQMATVFAIDIGGNNTTPEYFERLTGDVDHQGFSVSGPGALWNWINRPLINGTNPMNTFFQQLIAYQQNYVYNHPVPVTQIAADFIFAIDQTLLSQGNFTS